MKNSQSNLRTFAFLSGLVLIITQLPIFAADENSASGDERFQRLERRMNEIAERQEQMIHHLSGQQQPGQPQPNQQMQRRQSPPMQGQGPMPAPGPDNSFRRPMPGPGDPNPAKAIHDLGGIIGLGFLVWIICNILLTIWIFMDIRQRGQGSGIFVALALVAGIPAAIIYSLVRISDRLPFPPRPIG